MDREAKRAGVSLPSSEDGNSPSFRKVVFSRFLEYKAIKSRNPVIPTT
jgi:hypothetical protein